MAHEKIRIEPVAGALGAEVGGVDPAAPLDDATHPVVRTHPVTGRKGLFVDSVFTRSMVGMEPAESQSLLSFLYRHVASPDFTCRFGWRRNSVAMWDNRCTQHRVLADNLREPRRMERVTLVGDRPF